MASNNNDSQNQQSTYLGKAMEVCNGGDTKNQWDKLPNDMVQTLLGLLPTEDIFWCQMVSKTWYTILHSASFHLTSNQLFERCLWFLLVNVKDSYVYNMETGDLNPIKLKLPKERCVVPIAGSGGLVCFVSKFDNSSYMCNPYTGMIRTLPCFDSNVIDSTKGVAMNYSSSGLQYEVFVLYGNMQVKVFSSLEQEKAWIELPAAREYTSSGNWWINDVPIIGKKGITVNGSEGQILVLQNSTLICFNEEKGTISVCPQLSLGEKVQVLPVGLVECGGRVLAMISKRGRQIDIWEFDYKQTGDGVASLRLQQRCQHFPELCFCRYAFQPPVILQLRNSRKGC
ncbi:F-box only protein 13-like isoform X1 [Papaver somniferum]|uniref:F-box only protein 13-like isoform X1 n=1 Tax=Papaver somniferum TaxID=3469 RepID=UPI000E6F50AB|nr:F-box only protein 13-like isoform X1 [Papaver somniferum]XP_026435811.1 F-box only protein 13-like isoform X1 [Papaver somniferum]